MAEEVEPGVGLRGWASDLDAAVRWAASRQDWAVAGWDELAEGGRGYELLSVREEPGWLVCRADDWDEAAWFTGEASAQLGRFGDRSAERRLLRDVAFRLRQLAAKRRR